MDTRPLSWGGAYGNVCLTSGEAVASCGRVTHPAQGFPAPCPAELGAVAPPGTWHPSRFKGVFQTQGSLVGVSSRARHPVLLLIL